MLPVSPLEYLMTKVAPDYHAMIDLLGGRQSNAWKEKSIKANGWIAYGVNNKEAHENQVVHNMQAWNMLKLQDQWQELMSYAWNLGLYCFTTMVTLDPGNASAFSQNAIIYNNDVIGSFLKDHLDLLTLKGHFYKHILIATDQPDAALAHQDKEKELRASLSVKTRTVFAWLQWIHSRSLLTSIFVAVRSHTSIGNNCCRIW